MITVQIDDISLEQHITNRAKMIGKTAQQFVRDMLIDNLGVSESNDFVVRKLDYKKHSKVIFNQLTEEEEEAMIAANPSVKPFSHIEDSAEYVHTIRRKK